MSDKYDLLLESGERRTESDTSTWHPIILQVSCKLVSCFTCLFSLVVVVLWVSDSFAVRAVVRDLVCFLTWRFNGVHTQIDTVGIWKDIFSAGPVITLTQLTAVTFTARLLDEDLMFI